MLGKAKLLWAVAWFKSRTSYGWSEGMQKALLSLLLLQHLVVEWQCGEATAVDGKGKQSWP